MRAISGHTLLRSVHWLDSVRAKFRSRIGARWWSPQQETSGLSSMASKRPPRLLGIRPTSIRWFGTCLRAIVDDVAAFQRPMAKRAGATIVEVGASHSVYISQPQAVASLIERAAKSVAGDK